MEWLFNLVMVGLGFAVAYWAVRFLWAARPPKVDNRPEQPWETYRPPTRSATPRSRTYRQSAPQTRRSTDDTTYDASNPMSPLNPLSPLYSSAYDSTPHHSPSHHHDSPTPSSDYGGGSSSCDTGSSDSGGGGGCDGGGGGGGD